jgi:dTDP-4-amino-4,6-dideoxygalactose transaminase
VLADVGDELNLTVETVEPVLTRKTKTIIVPHLFGNPADIGPIVELAHKRNICVIDDAAQALGATIDGQPAGSFGDAGVLSFGKEKVCFGLGGGAVVIPRGNDLRHAYVDLTPAPTWATLRGFMSTLFWHRWRRWTLPLNATFSQLTSDGPEKPPIAYRHESMANLNAAVANSLMQSLPENLAARRARVRAYWELLEGVDGIQLVPHRPGSACLTQVAQISPGRGGHDLAAEIISTLGRAGFEIQGSYVPIHLLGHYPQCVWDRLPNAERIWADLIELPCEPSSGLDHVAQIASMVKGVICD